MTPREAWSLLSRGSLNGIGLSANDPTLSCPGMGKLS